MNNKLIRLYILLPMLLIMAIMNGCDDNSTTPGKIIMEDPSEDEVKITSTSSVETGESWPIVIHLDIPDADGTYARERPILYALAVDREYTVRCEVNRHSYLSGKEMNINIDLPPSIKLLDGETSWTGTDRNKVIELRIQTLEQGEFEITTNAVDISENLAVSNTRIVRIVGTTTEAEELIEQMNYEYEKGLSDPLPMEEITDVIE